MRELKPGDRVRVEFEATVAGWCSNVSRRAVAVTSPDALPGYVWVYDAACTLIEPEIVLPEIPGTIVQVDPQNKCGQRSTWYFEAERLWGPVGHLGRHATDDLVVRCRAYGYRVIPAAETKGVSE